MNIREFARENGGDEAVALIDRAEDIRKRIEAAVKAAVAVETDAIKDAELKDKQLVLASIAEALSTSYAEAAAEYGDATGTAEMATVGLALQSLATNLAVAHADIQTRKSGIAEKLSAIWKGGKKEEDK